MSAARRRPAHRASILLSQTEACASERHPAPGPGAGQGTALMSNRGNRRAERAGPGSRRVPERAGAAGSQLAPRAWPANAVRAPTQVLREGPGHHLRHRPHRHRHHPPQGLITACRPLSALIFFYMHGAATRVPPARPPLRRGGPNGTSIPPGSGRTERSRRDTWPGCGRPSATLPITLAAHARLMQWLGPNQRRDADGIGGCGTARRGAESAPRVGRGSGALEARGALSEERGDPLSEILAHIRP